MKLKKVLIIENAVLIVLLIVTCVLLLTDRWASDETLTLQIPETEQTKETAAPTDVTETVATQLPTQATTELAVTTVPETTAHTEPTFEISTTVVTEEAPVTPNVLFDPSMDAAAYTAWTPNCQEYISLWSAPDGDIITTVPKGATIELKGWNNKYAKVSYNGLEGFVKSNYIMPCDDNYFAKCLSAVNPTDLYAYAQMMEDMRALQSLYPNAVTVSSIGTTDLGTDIPVLVVGDLDAQHHILVQGAMHGLEHMTAWLTMAMADYWLGHGILDTGDVCYHFVPMSNPDGVAVAQSQTLNDDQRMIYYSDLNNGYTTKSETEYAAQWKANGKGVDINRNFPSGWEEINFREGPSAERYEGEEPFSTGEAAALRDYVKQYPFDVTLSYHSTGSVIYYQYGNKQPVNTQSESLANAVREVTGYGLVGSSGVDAAGFKDWAIDGLEIPSLTVEIGVDYGQLAFREIYSVFARNCNVLPTVANWIQ